MSLLRVVAASAILMCATACGGSSSTGTGPTPQPQAAGPSVNIPTGASTLGARAFAPDELTVTVGSTVTWTNTDAVSHTSTSDAAGWNSGTIAPGRQFSFAFQTAGTFRYHCSIHPGMIGTVTVQ